MFSMFLLNCDHVKYKLRLLNEVSKYMNRDNITGWRYGAYRPKQI